MRAQIFLEPTEGTGNLIINMYLCSAEKIHREAGKTIMESIFSLCERQETGGDNSLADKRGSILDAFCTK